MKMCVREDTTGGMDPGRAHGKAEYLEVRHWQRHLCGVCGREVPYDEAEKDWLVHCAVAWREGQQQAMLSLQREEMLKHKWIESEKAHRDLGPQAVLDWINNYAAQWRSWYERESDTRLQGEELTPVGDDAR